MRSTIPGRQGPFHGVAGRFGAPPHSFLLLLVLALLSACHPAASTPSPHVSGPDLAREEIATMLRDAARAWNAGDLDAFMADFAAGSGTTFIGSRGVLRGPSEIRAAYAPRFAAGAQRDSLRFEDLEVHALAPGVSYVIAYYVLHRGDSTTARGPTSLVMRRTEQGWRILHDHSS
jgi:uncharacterized protein (TIGR02246 family)